MAFDRNGDGKLVRAEVPERFQGLFDRADAQQGRLADPRGAASRARARQARRAPGARREGGGRGGRGRAGMDPMVRALDSDRDGAIAGERSPPPRDALKALDATATVSSSADEIRRRRAAGPTAAGRTPMRRGTRHR